MRHIVSIHHFVGWKRKIVSFQILIVNMFQRERQGKQCGDAIVLLLRDGSPREHTIRIQIGEGLILGSILRNTSRGINEFESVFKDNPSRVEVQIKSNDGFVDVKVVQ